MSIVYNTKIFGFCQIFLYNFFMELIKNEKCWAKYKKEKALNYNIDIKDIDANYYPDQYPCLSQPYLSSDMNGVRLKFIFVYKKDCQKLIGKV